MRLKPPTPTELDQLTAILLVRSVSTVKVPVAQPGPWNALRISALVLVLVVAQVLKPRKQNYLINSLYTYNTLMLRQLLLPTAIHERPTSRDGMQKKFS